jgi:hypothetical protein
MISVRDRLVTTSWSMNMPGIMTSAAMRWCAAIRIHARDLDHVLVDVVAVDMVQVPVVQVVDMAVVLYGGVPTIRAVQVPMIGVLRVRTRRHD